MPLSTLSQRLPVRLPAWAARTAPLRALRDFFAYHGVWAVGVRLLRRWTVRRKILLVVSLAALPMLPMSLHLGSLQSEAARAADRQISGGNLSAAVHRLIDVLYEQGRNHDIGRPVDHERLAKAVAEIREARAVAEAGGLSITQAWEAVDPALAGLSAGSVLSRQGQAGAFDTAHQVLSKLHAAAVESGGFLLTRDRRVRDHAVLAHLLIPEMADELRLLGRALRMHVAEQDRSAGDVARLTPTLLQSAGRIAVMDNLLDQAEARLAAMHKADLPEGAARDLRNWHETLNGVKDSLAKEGRLDAEAIVALRTGEEAAIRNLSALRQRHEQWLSAEHAGARQQAYLARNLMIASMLVSGSLALYLFYSFYLVMRGGLNVLNEQMQRISKGDFTLHQKPLGGDEVADTMRAMSLSVERLAELLASVRHGAGSVSQAAHQIASGNGDLRSRNYRTTESLQKVVEGVARYSSQLEACSVQVEKVVSTVQRLRLHSARSRRQMERLQETLTAVRNQSRQISDAVSLIDAVAFRTNILALNASVEASKAGEAGRGFAVVAQEVRSLAQRSAEAARRIGDIVGRSGEAVEQSARLAEETGKAIAESDQDIDGIHGAMSDVSTLTCEGQHESNAILEQVRALRETTEKNLGLVDQLASASNSLRSHGERLTHRLSHFRLG